MAPSLLPVLIVLHQETSTPGRIGNALRSLGYPLDIRRPRFGDVLPETLSAHAGAVIFGGPMSANDREDYVRREIGWIAVPLATYFVVGLPFDVEKPRSQVLNAEVRNGTLRVTAASPLFELPASPGCEFPPSLRLDMPPSPSFEVPPSPPW